MATNLLISYPQVINSNTVSITSTNTLDATGPGYPVANLLGGGRALTCRNTSTAYNTLEIIADLGSDTAVAWDHLIFAKVKAGKTWGATDLRIEARTAAGAYAAVGGTTTLNTQTLHGPQSEDIVFTSTLANNDSGTLPVSSTYRYVKLHFGKVSGLANKSAWELSKWYLGTFLDMGFDPIELTISNSNYGASDRLPHLIISIVWNGITTTAANNLITNVINYPDRGIFLHTKTNHSVLLGYKLIHCRVVDHNISRGAPDNYNISLTLEEMI